MEKIDEIKKILRVKPINSAGLTKLFSLYEIKHGTKVLLWCSKSRNKVSEGLAKAIYFKLKRKGCNVSLIVEKKNTSLGPASQKTQRAVLSLTKGDVFASVGSANRGYVEKEGLHVMMRALMKEQGFRMISIGGLDSIKKDKIRAFVRSLDHNQKEINALNKKIKKSMESAHKVRVTCPHGTDLRMEIGGRKVISNDGNWRDYSTNYPIGEVYTAPLENSADGIAFVSSAKVSGRTILQKKPIRFEFRKGILVSTNNRTINKNLSYVEKFNKNKKLKNWKNAPRTIAEFAIGTNRKASIVGAMICDEKTVGTCHFAIGNNVHLGGKTYCHGHFDNVIVKPSIWFDKKQIMKNGKLLL